MMSTVSQTALRGSWRLLHFRLPRSTTATLNMPTPRLTLLSATLIASLGLTATAQPLDPADLDARTSACIDFYQHANGGWLSRTSLPAGHGSWSRFDEINQRALDQQKALLDGLLQGAAGEGDTALLAAFWASAMDEQAIEAAGARPLAPLFARIDQARRLRDLAGVVADLHARGVPVLFNFGADIDLRDFGRSIAYATQGGLGLPDPDYYRRDDADARALLGRYRSHVERVLALSGMPEAERSARSGQILQIEMQLANAWLGLVELRNPYHAYKPQPLRELERRYPNLRLGDFVRAQGRRNLDSVSLAHERYFDTLNRLLGSVPLDQWQAYLRYHVANAMAPHLSQGFRNAHFELYGKLLAGQAEPAPRWQQQLATLDRSIGDALGRQYVQAYLPEPAREEALAVVTGVRDAIAEALQSSTWMGTEAKAAAAEKLATLRIEVGTPRRWTDYAGLSLSRTDFAGNVLAAAAHRHRQELASIGQTTELRWRIPTQTPDLSYDLALNRLTVNAGILQAPVFTAGGDPALNYGALGMLAGQQLTHAFDATGRTIDGTGQFRDWWTPADANGFEQRVSPLVNQYDNYNALQGIRVNGRQTRSENIADHGGLELAWRAFQASGAADGPAVANQSPAQRFFLGNARLWQRVYTDDELKLRLATDVHAPAKFRVNGPVSNNEAFHAAFGCRTGNPMYRPDAERVVLWR